VKIFDLPTRLDQEKKKKKVNLDSGSVFGAVPEDVGIFFSLWNDIDARCTWLSARPALVDMIVL
jgi:hypothetical protein